MWPGPLASSHAGPPLPQGYHSEGGIAGLTSPNPDGHPGQKVGGWGQLAGQGICSGGLHSPPHLLSILSPLPTPYLDSRTSQKRPK